MTTPPDDRLIASFIDAIAAERDAAENTRLAYARDLWAFVEWLQTGGLMDVDRAVIESHLAACGAQGRSKARRARRLSTLRQFYRFAHEEGWRPDNPALSLTGPGRDRRLPGTLDLPEVEALIAAARARAGTRDACLMELLYATGMRVTELVSLPVAAARGDPRVLLIRGKGGRERLVPLSPPAREALVAWLAERDAADAKRKAPSRHLFPSHGVLGHLTRQAFFLQIKMLAVTAGISVDKVSPHKIRHAFATHLLAGGADLLSIQSMLGHADVATTEIYTHVLDDALRDLVMDHHPLARDA